jgi:hypothetical protein
VSDLSREAIAVQADEAAQRTTAGGLMQANPYEAGTDDAKCWHAAYCRYLLKYSAPAEVEGGA